MNRDLKNSIKLRIDNRNQKKLQNRSENCKNENQNKGIKRSNKLVAKNAMKLDI